MSRTTTVPAAAAAKSSSSANNGIAAAAVPRRATESTRARSNEGTARGSRLRHAISPDFHHAILTATDRLFTVPKVNRMNDEDQLDTRLTKATEDRPRPSTLARSMQQQSGPHAPDVPTSTMNSR